MQHTRCHPTPTRAGKCNFASPSTLCMRGEPSNRGGKARGSFPSEEGGDAKLHLLSPRMHLPQGRRGLPARGRRRRRRHARERRTQKEEETTASLEKKAGKLSIWGWGRAEPRSCLAPPRPWPTGTGTKQRRRCVDLGLGTGKVSAATTNQQRRRGRSRSRLRAAELGGTEGSIRRRRTSIRPRIEHGEPLRPSCPASSPVAAGAGRSRRREIRPSEEERAGEGER
jgi:hypothetical protein